jgi:hypothetical protein
VSALGDSRARFYDDRSGETSVNSDYAPITDFGTGNKIQLVGSLWGYNLSPTTIGDLSGVGLAHKSIGNGRLHSTDEVLELVIGVTQVDSSAFLII